MNVEDWRRIDVDQYDPDYIYVADELPGQQSNASAADMQALSQHVRGSIQRMDIASALATAIEHAPYGAGEDVREMFLQSVFEILTSVKMNDVAAIVGKLDLDTLDVVAKFLYTLMNKEWALKQSGMLLVWLNKIVDTAGEGPIIRYMSDPYKL